MQAEILTKVTTLLTDNIEVLLPDLPKMRENMTVLSKQTEEVKEGGSKGLNVASEARDGLEELKGEFEYMKTRFSP